MWKYMVRRCHAAFSNPHPGFEGTLMQVRYEDLVSAPQTHGRSIVKFFVGKPNAALEKRLAQARTSSIGKHQRRDAAEVVQAESIAHEELALFGYLDAPSPRDFIKTSAKLGR